MAIKWPLILKKRGWGEKLKYEPNHGFGVLLHPLGWSMKAAISKANQLEWVHPEWAQN